MKQHAVGLEWLQRIATAVDSIKADGFSAKAFEVITDAVKYLGTEMHCHTENEEKYLFPLIDKHAFDSPTVLRHERREMWQAYNELQLSVRDVEEGRIHGTTMRELLQSAQLVVERFRNQIEKEDTIIFPMVKRLLTPVEYALLQQGITASI
jgi:iron-sulfur cluster repair protein YtfE (RIC family)